MYCVYHVVFKPVHFTLHIHHMQLKLDQGQRNTVARTLKNAYECHKHGIPYDGTRKSTIRRVPFIKLGSIESGLIADGMERNMGLSFRTAMTNEYRKTHASASANSSTCWTKLCLCRLPKDETRGYHNKKV